MGRTKLQLYISRLMALLLAAMLLFAGAPTAYADGETGICGNNLTWTLSAGTLTISGSGEMYDFPESTMAPWYHLRNDINRLELPNRLTKIGALAFYGCKNLMAVSVPGSVVHIGEYAFGECTGMQLLTINPGVAVIGEGAFTDCYKLTALTLPWGITSIGKQAFYRCESISAVTIPESVGSIGQSAFGYCKNLISVEIKAQLSYLPDFLFYGCERLTTVTLSAGTTSASRYAFENCDNLSTIYSGGTTKTVEQLQRDVGNSGNVSNESPPASTTVTTTQSNSDGSETVQNVTVSQGEGTTVTTTVETNQSEQQPEISAKINVTVENEEGWDEAAQIVQDQVDVYQDAVAESSGQTENIQVNVYVPNGTEVDPGFMENLAGQDVTVNVVTGDGSSWRVQGTELKSEDASGKYSLVYTLAAGTAELNTELGSTTSFYLAFHESSQVNTEVLIRLGTGWAQQQATLFQKTKDGLSQVQTVVVDQEGYAHFYLASVDKETEYFIAMNLFAKAEQEAIVPDEMLHAYGTPLRYEPIKYEITGRSSSWGMGLGTVMTILAVVMVSMIVIVGFVMYAWNKRRLKMGYVPDLSEEDYEI